MIQYLRRSDGFLLSRFLLWFILPGIIVLNPDPLAARHLRGSAEGTSDRILTQQPATDVILDARVAYDGVYRIGHWLPVYVTVQNSHADMLTEVRVHGQGGVMFAAPLDLPHGARKSITIYAFIPNFTRHLTVQLVPHDTASTDQTTVLAQQQLTLIPHAADAHMIAVISGATLRIPFPERLTSEKHIVSVDVGLQDIPDRFEGLSMFDTLILNDVATLELRDAQRAALEAWVLRGGQLLIAGGPGAQRVLAGLPTTLQPVRVSGLEQVAVAELPAINADAGQITLARVEPATPEAHILLTRNDNSPFLIEQGCGRGYVTFFGAAIPTPELIAWQQEPAFWVMLVHQRQTLPAGFGPHSSTVDAYTESNIATVLTRLPALELPSLQMLGILLLTYIVLVGPGTYFLLRMLDRQAWGWIIVPTLTVIFAAIAYGVGYAQRGGDVVLNQITLVEPLYRQGQDVPHIARVRSFVGLFSPDRRTYTLETARPVPLRPISLHGPWDTGTGHQNGLFFQSGSTLTPSGHIAAATMEVTQWSMRAVLGDELQPYHGITARLVLTDDILQALVQNESDQVVYDVVLVQGDTVVHLGTLQPGAQQSAELIPEQTQQRAMPGMPLSYLIYGDESSFAGRPGTSPVTPTVQLRSALLDAIYSYGPIPRPTRPMLLAWTDQALLGIDVPDRRVARQQLTLITLHPPLHVAGQRITLNQGWFDRQIQANDEQKCVGFHGLGFILSGPPVIMTLRLPPEMIRLEVEALSLLPLADNVWPIDATVELFDWSSGEWVAQTVQSPSFPIADPARFVNNRGEIRLQISGQLSFQDMPGCMTIDATLTGMMPGGDVSD